MKTIYYTTAFLILFIAFSQLDSTSFMLMSILFIIGNALVIFMVYKTLTDYYKTSKNFENWYEDNPRKIQE